MLPANAACAPKADAVSVLVTTLVLSYSASAEGTSGSGGDPIVEEIYTIAAIQRVNPQSHNKLLCGREAQELAEEELRVRKEIEKAKEIVKSEYQVTTIEKNAVELVTYLSQDRQTIKYMVSAVHWKAMSQKEKEEFVEFLESNSQILKSRSD